MELQNICRICLRTEFELLQIFDEKYAEENVNVAKMLTECTIYKVERFDNLPQLICITCVEELRTSYHFKLKCETSYRNFLQLLGNSDADSYIKQKRVNGYAEQSTQTEDISSYPCELCDANFITFDALRLHRRDEHKENTIVCRFCRKSFNRIAYLQTHIAVVHPETGNTSRNQCPMCDRLFTRRAHLRRHLATVHKFVETEECANHGTEIESGNKQPVNLLNDTLMTDINASDAHKSALILNESNGDNFKLELDECSLSADDLDLTYHNSANDESDDDKPLSNLIEKAPAKGFLEVLIDESASVPKYNKRLQDLEQLEFDVKPVICATNPIEQTAKTKLRKRLNSQKSFDTHACKACEKSFNSAKKLDSHMQRSHSEAKDIKCEVCNGTFAHKSDYNCHMKTHLHKCRICSKTLKSYHYLQRHMVSHDKKRYVCKECKQAYPTKEELVAHRREARHDRPLLCPECGLRCKTSNILMVHLRRHTGEKPFKCKFCSKGFPRMDDVKVHEKYHTGEKSHFCETCGKGFQRKYNLTIHLRVHTGEKPYKCSHCGQAFAQSNDLKSHIRRHTGERFRCEICGAAFLQGYQIRQHKLTEHGIKEVAPTQRVAKFPTAEEQALQIQQNLQQGLTSEINAAIETGALTQHESAIHTADEDLYVKDLLDL